MTIATHPGLPSAYEVLHHAVLDKRAVRLRYHGHQRIVCPHVIGWKNGQLVILVYQCAGTTSGGELPPDPHHRWRSLRLDDIAEVEPAPETPWQTANNYTTKSILMDSILSAAPTLSKRYCELTPNRS